MVELVLEADHLVLKLNNFTFTVDKLGLLVFQIKGLSIDKLIQIIDPCELFGYIVLKCSCLGSQICAFLALEFVLIIELIDFFGVLSVSVSQVMELLFEVFLLLKKL